MTTDTPISPDFISAETAIAEPATSSLTQPADSMQEKRSLPLPDDKFSKGKIIKYFPQSKYGFIKDRAGRDVYFNVEEVRFVGSKGRDHLKEGLEVGYDVAWTSKGIHIEKIKIY